MDFLINSTDPEAWFREADTLALAAQAAADRGDHDAATKMAIKAEQYAEIARALTPSYSTKWG